LLAAINPPRSADPLGAARALQIGTASRYDSYDSSNIIEQYRDIVLNSVGRAMLNLLGAKFYG
jgi:hypothetical protein